MAPYGPGNQAIGRELGAAFDRGILSLAVGATQHPIIQLLIATGSLNSAGKWIPENGETHPLHADVQEALQCSRVGSDCELLAWSIEVILLDLRFRRWDMQRYAVQNSGMFDPGHVTRYYGERGTLADLVRAAKSRGCPYNQDADREIAFGHKYPTPRY